jgi:hypothetical protein
VQKTALPPLSSRASHTSATIASTVHPKLNGGSRQTHFLGQACLFKVRGGACPSPSLWSTQGILPFCYMSFSVPCFLFIFFQGGGLLDCPGGYAGLSQGWLWGYHMPLICSPVGLHLPSRLGAVIWRHGSLLVFPNIMVCGSYVLARGLGGVRVLPLLGGFSCQVCLQHLSKFLL